MFILVLVFRCMVILWYSVRYINQSWRIFVGASLIIFSREYTNHCLTSNTKMWYQCDIVTLSSFLNDLIFVSYRYTFNINHGVKHSCVLAPTLFTLYLALVLETVESNLSKGVYIRTRSDSKLFNLARLKASTKTREVCVRVLLYADDSALVSTNAKDMQEIVTCFATTSTMFGLKINVSKTELLHQPFQNIQHTAQRFWWMDQHSPQLRISSISVA